MVDRHQLDRLAAQHLCPVELAVVQHHLAEAVIILRRRAEPAAAREISARPAIGIIGRVGKLAFLHDLPFRDHLEPFIRIIGIRGGEARDLIGRQEEVGVLHPQRFENALLQEPVERHSGDSFHQVTQHIIRQAVFPLVARLKQQRKRRQLLDRIACRSFLLEEPCADSHGVVRLAQPRIPGIGKAGGVRQQIEDGDGALGVHQGAGRRGLVLGKGRVQDFHVLEFRNEVGDRLIQREASFFIEHHHGGAGDRLGHRADAENVVGAHGLLRLAVRHPERFEIGNLAVPRHQATAPAMRPASMLRWIDSPMRSRRAEERPTSSGEATPLGC